MKHSRSTALAFFGGIALAIAIPGALASCAEHDDSAAPSPPPGSLLDAAALDGSDANVSDSAGDASQEASEWSVVPTNIGALYALTSVWGSSKDDIWASGSGGTVLHWDGATWTEAPLPTEPGQLPLKNTFRALWGSGPNDVWVASTTDLIFHSDGFKNGSAGWKRYANVVHTTPVSLYAAWGTGPDDLRFGGRTYYARSPDGVFLANQVIKKAPGGESDWGPGAGTAVVRGFWGASSDDIWLIGDNRMTVPWQIGFTAHGSRKGDDFVWTEVDSRASVVLRGIWGSSSSDGSDVWAVGDQGTIRHFLPKATEWQVVESPSAETLHAVWGSAANDVWAVGESGTILHWDGVAWSTSRAAFPDTSKLPHLYGIWGSSPTDVWIVGEGAVLHYTGKLGGSK